MIPQITRALSSGFTSKQVIDFILKKFPEHSDKIKTAMAAGFSVDQVLKYLSGGKKAVAKLESFNPSSQGTEHEQTRSIDLQRRENVNKAGIAAGTLAAGAIAAPMAAGALQRALPSSLSGLIPNILQSQPSTQSSTASPVTNIETLPSAGTSIVPPLSSNTSQPPINAPNIPQTPNIQPPQIKPLPTEITGKIDELIRSGNGPEEVTAYFKNFNPKAVKEVEKSSGLPFGEAVKQHIENSPKTSLLKTEEETDIKPIEKHQTVISPQGAGEVREIRGDKALIEVDGRLHKVNVDELIESPLPEKDISDLYEELISTIEKKTGEDVSRMVNYAGYDPKTNKLVFLPHDGALYEYSDIEPEEVELLTNILNVRKTSGENFIGAWKAGSKSPIGSAMSALIKKLQSQAGGKGKEYSGKYETVYSYLEPAIKAAKKKKKKK